MSYPQIPARALITDGGIGPNQRVRVDVAQTGFFQGRHFRTFKEWQVAATEVYTVRAAVPIDIILFELSMEITAGEVRLETLAAGTQAGTFSEVLPVFPGNTMLSRPLPYYAPVVVLAAGGTHTGGTLLDVLHVKAADNSNFAASVGSGAGAERGVGPGTYYFRLTLTGVIGTFKARWEER